MSESTRGQWGYLIFFLCLASMAEPSPPQRALLSAPWSRLRKPAASLSPPWGCLSGRAPRSPDPSTLKNFAQHRACFLGGSLPACLCWAIHSDFRDHVAVVRVRA